MNFLKNDFTNFRDNHLSFIGQECASLPKILGTIYGEQTKHLDLSFNSLGSFEGLEMFPHLEELVLDNNRLNDAVRFIQMPHLHTLSLNKNYFHDLDGLLKQVATCFPQLKYLSLLGNPACPDQLSNHEKDETDYQLYRYYVLHHLPHLSFLDSTPVKRSERIEAQKKGQFLKIVRTSDEMLAEDPANVEDVTLPYTPLPPHVRKSQHKGSFGKLRQRYTGTQSEGNRFIRDSEL